MHSNCLQYAAELSTSWRTAEEETKKAWKDCIQCGSLAHDSAFENFNVIVPEDCIDERKMQHACELFQLVAGETLI